jgi:hypothetical protein
MNWIVTNTAREHALSGPLAQQADNIPGIREIAHSLGQINRYTGHASRPYSVAEHSLLVSDLAEFEGADTRLVLCALMHDAHECIVGDVASPVKAEVGLVWHAFEWEQQAPVLRHYDLLTTYQEHAAAIKRWDLIALATERRDLMPFNAKTHRAWPVIDTPGKVIAPAAVNLNSPWRQKNTWQTWAWLFENKTSLLLEKLLVEQHAAAKGIAA